MDSGFAAINARFDNLVATLGMERRIEQMEARFASQNDRPEVLAKSS
jgi:hypothetical protein